MFTPALSDRYIICSAQITFEKYKVFYSLYEISRTIWDLGKSKQMHFLTPKAGMRISPCFSCLDQLNNWIKNIWIKKKPLCSYFWAFRQKNDWGGVRFVWLISGENNLRSTIKLKIEYQEHWKLLKLLISSWIVI